MSASNINWPSDINGVIEIGIAAGVDDFTDLGYCLTVVTVPDPLAPTKPSDGQVRAVNVASQWASLPDADARATFFNDPAAISGPMNVPIAQVRACFLNWPKDEAEARATSDLACPDAASTVADYESWLAIPVDIRPHVSASADRTLLANEAPTRNVLAQKVWQSLVAYSVKHGWIIKREVAAHGLVRYAAPEAPPADLRTIEQVNAIGFFKGQQAATLIVALKLTWWLINHHVGQADADLQGYIGKVARATGIVSSTNASENREVRNVLWAVGKMVTTRGILAAAGCKGIIYWDGSNTGEAEGNDYARCGDITLKLSDDAKLRVNSAPAGTANFSVYHALAMRAQFSLFAVCVPALVNMGYDHDTKSYIGPVATTHEDILANPAAYHMGARFLTGDARKTCDVFNDEEKVNLSAFIHASDGANTLAKSPVVRSIGSVASSIPFTTITSVRTKMADSMGPGLTLMLINRLAKGATQGGMAVQFGKLTAEEVQEDIKMLEAAEGGDVSEDEKYPSKASKSVREAIDKRNANRAARRVAKAKLGK